MPDHGKRSPSAERRGGPPAAASLGRGRRADRAPPLLLDDVSRGMVVRRMSVAPAEVVFVKGVVEASDGVAAVFAESGGELSIVSPIGREAELAELLEDLAREVEPAHVCGASASDHDLLNVGAP